MSNVDSRGLATGGYGHSQSNGRLMHRTPLSTFLFALAVAGNSLLNGALADEPAVRWRQTAVLPAAEANQAAAADERFVYAIDNAVVAKYDRRTGERLAISTGTATHLNSGFLWDGRLYCAHSNYPKLPEQSEIKVLDLQTMRLAMHKDFGNYGGSLTWAIRDSGHWWCNFARYGDENAGTFLVKFDTDWKELGRWTYPGEVLRDIGRYSLSGGVWRGDSLLVTDHDHPVLYRLRLPNSGTVLEFVEKQAAPFTGQGIAADPVTGGLIGIHRAQRQIVFAKPSATKSLLTRKQPVIDNYHGTSVTDDYRWLEDAANPDVRKWSDAQNTAARVVLDHLPHVAAIRARVTEIMTARTVSYSALAYRKGNLFAIVRQPPKQQPFLVVMPAALKTGEWRVVVDPNVLDPASATSIDWYVPSPDGKLLAVSLSNAGTETGDVHFFEAATGRQVHEVVTLVNTGTAGGDLAWAPDGSGIFYTKHLPAEEGQPADLNFRQQVYYHQFGTALTKDRYELGRDFPRVAEIEFEVHEPSGTLLASVQNGDGGEFAHYLRSPSGTWTQFTRFEDKVVQATFGPQGDLFLISHAGASHGKILHLPQSVPELRRAATVVPEGADTVVSSFYHSPPSLLATENRLYVLYQLGGPTAVRVFDFEGKRLGEPAQRPLSSVGGLTRLDGDDVLFSSTSYTEPPAVYRWRAAAGTTDKTPLATESPVDFRDVEVVREFAVSKDGTRVPVTILMPRGTKLDGSNPALVTGYGGYGISMTPSFSSVRHVLLEQGFVWAIANLRGGSEFGETWHRQGNLTNKQNVFDDFAAVLRHLLDRSYTSSSRLAIEGGSNGGLLMGATFTQHPELMKAVVSHVGIYDMLRVELSPNGKFNIVEFGTVTNADQFRALHAYSPYHRVQDGVRYPAVLFLTGANDPRVDPMQSRKMTARLQVASASDAPILLRTSSNSGHGAGTALSERIEQTVDVDAFLLDQLGVRFRPRSAPGPAPK